MATAPRYYISIVYNGKNISSDVTSHLVSLKYTDHVHGKSDEIEITLEDVDAKWRNDWYPKKGDKIVASIGEDKDSSFDCGEFEIDEIELSGPPDTVTIRALATGHSSALRTKNSSAHEGKTLKEIAQTIAANHGLTIDDGGYNHSTKTPYNLKDEANQLIIISKFLYQSASLTDTEVKAGLEIAQKNLGNTNASLVAKQADKQSEEVKKLAQSLSILYSILVTNEEADRNKRNTTLFKESTYAAKLSTEFLSVSGITLKTNIKAGALDGIVISRSTQNREEDLSYLKRLCDEYGIVFSIRGTVIYFTTVYSLEAADISFSLDRQDIISYSFKDKIGGTYKAAAVKHRNPDNNEVIESETDSGELEGDYGDTSNDTLEVRSKAENQEQADAKSKAALHDKNSESKSVTITTGANKYCVAGVNFEFTGMGAASGKYHIISASHTIDRDSGYSIESEIKHVDKVDPVKAISKPVHKTVKPKVQSKVSKNTGFADGIGQGQNGFAY